MLILILPQIETSDDPGQGAVRDAPAVLVLEDFLNPNHIALRELEYLLKDGGKLLVGGLPQWSLLPLSPEDPSDRVTREFEELADLPDLDSLLIEAQDGLLALLRDLHDEPSSLRFQVS